ncbi:AbiH family protein [Flavobacterium terrae]|uniref:Bacteriophage abortive infection AbiH n=1 Tax=Flavobacterium terrae TaxID=415425 RepID=A0A1M6B852_9FLAO|nr:AbiH family protein [Flavobacterium terrae]SHI44906.1 Bacteriophage abortive infection AbiH [Flavobacterium terrae]
MNRLVIVGNGFDLAHGLPTSYRNFIDDFWANFKDNHKNELGKSLVCTNNSYDGYYSRYGEILDFKDFKAHLKEYCIDNGYNFYESECVAKSGFNDVFRFKNDFFKKINVKNSGNWVDIENEYYTELKKIVNSKSLDVLKTEEEWKNEQKEKVEKLNKEFDEVKSLLESYLLEKVEEPFMLNKEFHEDRDRVSNEIYSILRPISLFNSEKKILDEFIDSSDKREIEAIFTKEKLDEGYLNKTRTLVVNFNYTSTLRRYMKLFHQERLEVSEINIHGKLFDKNNQINFGFGDEMDEDYKIIENINDNEYLRNFKSFQYLQNSNYSNLLSFIESEKFQVLIMGHSCGLSDRTLLNTIFEHNNCRSMKVFYYKNGEKDNYTEIVQNISRHFNKKKLMREKIVNKTLSEPLQQIKLPKYKVVNGLITRVN